MATVDNPTVAAASPGLEAAHPLAERSPAVRRWRFNVDEYYRMAEAGIFHEDSRVELIEGDIIAMSPIGSRRAACVVRLTALLTSALGIRAFLSPQNPIRLDDHSEPEPDVMLLTPKDDYYASAHPGAADVLLLVEVMNTSADDDRKVKLGLYARSGVPEVWLVDLKGELVEVYRRPAGEAYAENSEIRRGQSLAPGAFPDVVLGVDAIFG